MPSRVCSSNTQSAQPNQMLQPIEKKPSVFDQVSYIPSSLLQFDLLRDTRLVGTNQRWMIMDLFPRQLIPAHLQDHPKPARVQYTKYRVLRWQQAISDLSATEQRYCCTELVVLFVSVNAVTVPSAATVPVFFYSDCSGNQK
jgi:hypothetical protein